MLKITPFVFAVILLVVSCSKPKGKIEPLPITDTIEEDPSEIIVKNYAAVWSWASSDVDKITALSPNITSELVGLWNEGHVENVYYDAESIEDKLSNLPNITFFVRAKSIKDAELMLNKLTVVKEGIATFQLYPVGILWLKRKDSLDSQQELKKSFVSIWSPTQSKPGQDDIKVQQDSILELWNRGAIENVYLDINAEDGRNRVTDFVFFVNADSEEVAKKVCESLPFSKNGFASYRLHQVGVHWMGRSDK